MAVLNILTAALLLTTFVLSATVSGHFCYSEHSCDESSEEWGGVCKTGKSQSPIDINPLSVQSMSPLLPNLFNSLTSQKHALTFNSGYAADAFYIIDNGHTVQVQLAPTTTSSAKMTGYELNGDYILAQCHFHWKSEHTILGIRKPMEVHFVHYAEKYGSVTAAVASKDPHGLAVVGVFLEPSLLPIFPALKPIADNMQRSVSESVVKVNQHIDLRQLLPKSGDGVYRYNGSLTTPGCDEVVEWTLKKDPIMVNAMDMAKFIGVRDDENEILIKNYRTTKPLNGRTVEYFTVA